MVLKLEPINSAALEELLPDNMKKQLRNTKSKIIRKTGKGSLWYEHSFVTRITVHEKQPYFESVLGHYSRYPVDNQDLKSTIESAKEIIAAMPIPGYAELEKIIVRLDISASKNMDDNFYPFPFKSYHSVVPDFDQAIRRQRDNDDIITLKLKDLYEIHVSLPLKLGSISPQLEKFVTSYTESGFYTAIMQSKNPSVNKLVLTQAGPKDYMATIAQAVVNNTLKNGISVRLKLEKKPIYIMKGFENPMHLPPYCIGFECTGQESFISCEKFMEKYKSNHIRRNLDWHAHLDFPAIDQDKNGEYLYQRAEREEFYQTYKNDHEIWSQAKIRD